MRTLAIETATEACSVALFEGDALIDARHEVLGRGHAERLVPMIAGLQDQGRADAIRVSLGPGSFTGVRIGLAVARALGIAWSAEVSGYPTLALVAALARSEGGMADPERPLTVCMNGGHGQWFVQNYNGDGTARSEASSLQPAEAAAAEVFPDIAGNRAEDLAAMLGDGTATPFDCLPDARHALGLPDSVLTSDLSPIYGRAPDAKAPAR